MASKRQAASSARLMALNSMCAMACSSAASPSGLKGERLGTLAACTSSGRAGQPGCVSLAPGAVGAINNAAVCSGKAKAMATLRSMSGVQKAL
jgi:3-oxoacyl-[acyl-carrier-protein] synthase III